MNIFNILLYSISIAAFSVTSATIRENKLCVIYKHESGFIYEFATYELNGTITDIFNSKKSINMNITDRGFDFEFSDAPDTQKDYINRLWLKSDQVSYDSEINRSNSKFMGYINVSDMSYIEDTSSVKFPAINKFPRFGYTMNKVAGKYGSALYVTGGVLYSKRLDAYISSNSFFMYSFTTKEWIDMSSKYNGKLDPIYNHRSVIMDNRYIVVFGGKIAKDPTKDSVLNINDNKLFKVNSVYNLMKFDTVANNWENIRLNTSMFDSSIASLQLSEFAANFYSNKVYLLGGLVTNNENRLPDLNTKLGILDYKAKQWTWSPIFDESGNTYESSVEVEYSLVYNNQIILISGKLIEKDSNGLQVFDLKNQRMRSTLKANYIESDTESSNRKKDQPPMLPSYAIILLAISCTVLVTIILFFICYEYYYNKKTSQNRNIEPKKLMEPIWSNPEDPNMEYILYGTKENSIYFDSEYKYSGLKLENRLFEKANSTQGYFTTSIVTTNTSTTLQSNSSNY